jgi:uncharacterized protein (TIGR00297 family)
VALWTAVVLAASLGLVGYALRWLTVGGTVSAVAVGAAILWSTGLGGGALLASLFVTGSALTYARRDRVTPPERRGRRAAQVLANGGLGAVGAIMAQSLPGPGWALMSGSLAAAQADTWATELGIASGKSPRLITTGVPVPPGTSGGMTVEGTAGGLAGAALLATLAFAYSRSPSLAFGALAGGVAGMAVDSLAGATIQVRYRCTVCGSATERPHPECGGHAVQVGGVAWIDNDAVNLLGTAVGGAVAMLIGVALAPGG